MYIIYLLSIGGTFPTHGLVQKDTESCGLFLSPSECVWIVPGTIPVEDD